MPSQFRKKRLQLPYPPSIRFSAPFLVSLFLTGCSFSEVGKATAAEASQILESKTVSPRATAKITVTVVDANGLVVAGVEVQLVGQADSVMRRAVADSKGALAFTDLPAGTYRLRITSTGLMSAVSGDVVVATGEQHQVSMVAVAALTTTTTVKVTATLNEVAQEQVAEQEKQRIMGVLPNYYVSYIWEAVPMTPKLKYNLAIRSITDPVTFLVTAGVTGVEHAHKTFPGYEQGAEGFAKRYATAYGDTVAAALIGRALLPSVLHQDPRYFYRGSGSIRSRLFYALSAAVVTRGDNGRAEPNYSAVMGSFAAAGISNLYRAPGDRSASLTFRNGLIVVGSGAIVNVMREFLSRRITSNVPVFANGKP